ncbi:TPA: BspA family leucine-rich repeat surface protein, partial [Listeria monocytogenes]|nr:BspA family leucine-rich repeat surface protein [Listeria monocytogenes]HEM1291624.1 BspA family leucine-rich repeat surface protein [Listeria monocytogenes]
LDTSNIIAEEVAQEKPAEVEQLEEIPTTDELMQNPDVLEKSVADSDDPDLTVVSSGDFWTIYRNTVNNEYNLRMFGNVPSSRPTAWNSYLKSIKHIEIEEATLTGSFASYFRGTDFPVLESVRIEQCNLSGVTSFEMAFYNSGIEKVIIRDNDYPKAPSLLTATQYMFSLCRNLSELDLSGLDTSAVTNMYAMFQNCTSLEELDLSNFDTSSATNMYSMFSGCRSLEKLDVSNFDTSSVAHMQFMFEKCSILEELDLSNFDTSSVTNMSYMFQLCPALKSLYLDNFTDAAIMTGMFAGTTSLTYLFVSHNLSTFNNLENTSWYDEKNWVQFSNLSQLQTYHRQQSEPIGYRKGAFLS